MLVLIVVINEFSFEIIIKIEVDKKTATKIGGILGSGSTLNKVAKMLLMEVLVDDEIDLPDIIPSQEKSLGKRRKYAIK